MHTHDHGYEPHSHDIHSHGADLHSFEPHHSQEISSFTSDAHLSSPYDQTNQLSKDESELAAAQHNKHEVRVRLDGENLLLPKDAVDPSKVELKCDDHHGCYLVPDDNNPYNDVVPDDHHSTVTSSTSASTQPSAPSLSNDYYTLSY